MKEVTRPKTPIYRLTPSELAKSHDETITEVMQKIRPQELLPALDVTANRSNLVGIADYAVASSDCKTVRQMTKDTERDHTQFVDYKHPLLAPGEAMEMREDRVPVHK